jgi:hypothetical protein
METVGRFHRLLLRVSQVRHKSSPDKKKFHPCLEGPSKGTSPHVPQNWATAGQWRASCRTNKSKHELLTYLLHGAESFLRS